MQPSFKEDKEYKEDSTMAINKRIPIGIENFKEMIDKDYYYVDKTNFINDVLDEKVVLYTRPRRFGKTLNMSMLYYFFSNKEKSNAYLFDGLKISDDKEALKHQNQYPVIFISLKEMKSFKFEEQKEQFAFLISQIMTDYSEVMESETLDQTDKAQLKRYRCGNYTDLMLKNSLLFISQCLYKHFHQKVIILIDEYDVPLQDAYLHDYYEEMVDFLRSVFSAALKTNNALEKGILTGCLRIAKESIFTGLNNFNVYSIFENVASQAFGFTPQETQKLFEDYDFRTAIETAKEWYDGYLFGNSEIYNPWSILKYVLKHLQGNNRPESFWANTSGNDIVKKYIEHATSAMKEEFEQLMNGQTIVKRIKPELTYREMDFDDDDRINDDVYSFLLFTGYLKTTGQCDDEHGQLLLNTYQLAIPNREIKEIYRITFMDWFARFQKTKNEPFIKALIDCKTDQAIDLLTDVLLNSISYYDNYESFYHGFMLGFLQNLGYQVISNQESGDGRFDIALVPSRLTGTVLILECKHSQNIEKLIQDSETAAKQIETKKYKEKFVQAKYRQIIGYGISFYKKQCYITKL